MYEEIIELAKRRGYLYPSFEIYGGASGFWDYGPLGTELKNNLLAEWRESFVTREGFDEIETTTVGKEDVFEASGHASGFADVLVQCPDCDAFFRADHLVEDNTGIENADGMSPEELGEIIAGEEIVCPGCGNDLSGAEPREFNLMFETNIGPQSGRKAYLRPETAQGIFVDYPRLRRFNRDSLPFGVAQTGRAYRNEINPRKGIVRLREFVQAELEYFKHPDREVDDVKFDGVADTEVRLYPVEEQEDEDGKAIETTVRDAVESGIIESRTIAYFVGKAQEWYESVGIDPERLRFRQHLPDERAHYASDCWDGETYTDRFGWIEVNGVADRGSYDLSKHAEASGEEMGVFEEYDEPVTKEKAVVDPDMSVLGPEYGSKAGDVADALEELAEEEPERFENHTVEVEVDGETYEVETDVAGFEIREIEENGRNVLPQVIEPSFGVDRIIYSVIEHSYAEDEVDDEERTVLRLPSNVAPFIAGVFPLMTKDGLGEKAKEIRESLRRAGLRVRYDESGAIGRRYRRHDEIGTPYTVTVDYDTLEDGTVTVRDRDTTQQVRVAADDLPGILEDLRDGRTEFGDL
ncbi:glycine--tRNA ligase [Halorutilales archaeon Cl-col2-1]